MSVIAKSLHSHVPALDGLRGVAILLVLVHAFDILSPSGIVSKVADIFLNIGWIGVQLFFVLSGFLITGILLDSARSPNYYRNFFARRFLRIFPLYYGVLFVSFVLVPLFFDVPPSHGEHQLWLWICLENFAAPFGRSETVFPHFWSLCVEEQFYLLWPLAVRSMGRRGIIALGTALTVLAILSRIWIRHRYPGELGENAAYVFTFCRMDALAIGAMTAAFLRNAAVRAWVESRSGVHSEVLGIGLVAAGCMLGQFQRTGLAMQWFGYTIMALGFAWMIVAALQPSSMSSRVLAWRPLCRVGTYSYAMYIFHAPLHLLVGLPMLQRFDPDHGLMITLVYTIAMTALTFALGALSYHLFERRFLSLKSRFASAPRAEAS